MSTSADDRAHQEARKLVQKGQYERASYYFVNALTRNPGDISLIEDFVACLRMQAQAAVKEDQADRAHDYLDRCVSLLYDRVPFVVVDDILRLLELGEQFGQERDALSVVPLAEDDPRDIQARKDLKLLQSGKIDTCDTGTAEDLQTRLERLRLVLQFVTSGGADETDDRVPCRFSFRSEKARQVEMRGDFMEGGWEQGVKLKNTAGLWSAVVLIPVAREIKYKFFINGADWQCDPDNPEKDIQGENSLLRSMSFMAWLERTISQLETALQFEMVFADGQRLLVEAGKKKHLAAAALCLQGAEQVARQLVTWTLPGERQERVGELLDELRIEGDKLADMTRKAESEAVWLQLQREVASLLKDIRSWTPTTNHWKSGHIQKQIERLQAVMKAFQEMASRITAPDVIQMARELAEELGKLMSQATQVQQKEYNRWVMTQLTEMMRDGDKFTGMVDDEKALGDSMVAHFGPIDTRLLTTEVNRCYSEVFEHLFSHLDKPDDEKDFAERGHKLWLLKKLFEHDKTQLTDF